MEIKKSHMKSLIKSLVERAGFDIVRRPKIKSKSSIKKFYFESDDNFISLHKKAIELTESTHNPMHERLYNTVQFLIHTLSLEGEIVECGCFKGLSSYMFCNYARQILGEFSGENYHIFDSFEGISEPSVNDLITSSEFGKEGEAFKVAGSYRGSLEDVKKTLGDFPNINYHPGWIPNTFQGLPERRYKFVHLDLDLYEPIRPSIDYFYPRLVPGGVIVVDEYGFPRWPGAKRAVDEFCSEHAINPIELTTGNGVLIKI